MNGTWSSAVSVSFVLSTNWKMTCTKLSSPARSVLRRFLFAVFLPLIWLPLLFMEAEGEGEGQESKKFRCAYVIALMATYWMTEALPLAVTSLLPIVLFPLLEIQDTGKVTMAYMKETNMMLIGGMIVAIGMEYSNLHLRIALRVMTLRVMRASPSRLLVGVMLTTAFLSMWMSNTATTAMMIPIVLAFVEELNQLDENAGLPVSALALVGPSLRLSSQFDGPSTSPSASSSKGSQSQSKESLTNSKKMYLLAVGYASKIGGNGAITATAPNLVFQELIKRVDISQGGKYLDINFSTWLALNVPGVVLNVLVSWMYLMAVYLWPRRVRSASKSSPGAVTYFKKKYADLGPITFHEAAIGLLFFCLVLLWFTRDPGFMPGWAHIQHAPVKIGDSTAAMLIVCVMFVVPKDLSFSGALLDWNYVQSKLPWGTVLLLGAGFAVSEASIVSGLSGWIGQSMGALKVLSHWAILLIVMIIVTLSTEIISNAACANLFLPILITMSETLGLHPLYLTIPATITCSYAFMFPSASPTSSLVFAAAGGDLTILDMIKNGVVLNISCVLVYFALHLTYGNWLFEYDQYEYPK